MIYKTKLYRTFDQITNDNEELGPVIVEQKEDGKVHEFYSDAIIKAYVTADQLDNEGNKQYFPNYDDQKDISSDIENDGFSLFIVSEDLDENNTISAEDINYFIKNPDKYPYNIAVKEKLTERTK